MWRTIFWCIEVSILSCSASCFAWTHSISSLETLQKLGDGGSNVLHGDLSRWRERVELKVPWLPMCLMLLHSSTPKGSIRSIIVECHMIPKRFDCVSSSNEIVHRGSFQHRAKHETSLTCISMLCHFNKSIVKSVKTPKSRQTAADHFLRCSIGLPAELRNSLTASMGRIAGVSWFGKKLQACQISCHHVTCYCTIMLVGCGPNLPRKPSSLTLTF